MRDRGIDSVVNGRVVPDADWYTSGLNGGDVPLRIRIGRQTVFVLRRARKREERVVRCAAAGESRSTSDSRLIGPSYGITDYLWHITEGFYDTDATEREDVLNWI